MSFLSLSADSSAEPPLQKEHLFFQPLPAAAERRAMRAPSAPAVREMPETAGGGELLHRLFEMAGLAAQPYRGSALQRRLKACLRVLGAADAPEALRRLEKNPALVAPALSAVLLGVTEFFRDAPVFEALEKCVLPGLSGGGFPFPFESLRAAKESRAGEREAGNSSRQTGNKAAEAGKGSGEAGNSLSGRGKELNAAGETPAENGGGAGISGRPGLRVWSAACSDGRELCSVAMLLEEAGILQNSTLLGTDFRAEAVRQAARGEFPAAVLESLSAERRERHFTGGAGGVFHLSGPLRRALRWRAADLLQETAAGPWDLILWRNMAIYLQHGAADQVWRRLYHELRPGGCLITGRAEQPPRDLPLARLHPCLYLKSHVSPHA